MNLRDDQVRKLRLRWRITFCRFKRRMQEQLPSVSLDVGEYINPAGYDRYYAPIVIPDELRNDERLASFRRAPYEHVKPGSLGDRSLRDHNKQHREAKRKLNDDS